MGHQWSLPPTDGAYGASPFVLLTDPSVQFVTAAVVFPASALGLIGARIFLWNTRFALTVPIVSAVSILVCLLGGRLSFFVVPVALLAALVAMAWCEERFPAKGVERRTRRSLRA